MALIQCEECGKLVSDSAIICPQCKTNLKNDSPQKKEKLFEKIKINRKKTIISIGVLGSLLLFFVLYYFIFSIPSIEKLKDSVVMIEVYDENYELVGTGSGFCAYEPNYIVTNFHVIEGASAIKVITDDNEEYKAENIVIFNKEEDLAILSIDGNLKAIKLGDGNKVKTKDKVTTIGSPMGEKNTVSEGIVSNSDEKDVIRITAPISHGSSGGVLLNSKNKVIGITSAGYDNAQNLNFAINVNVLNKIYSAYKNNKYDVIEKNNYKECAPNIINYNTDNRLQIKNKCTFSSYNNYSAESLEAFYLSTNSYEIFNTAMYKLGISGLNVNYKKLSKEKQKLASQYYTQLLQYEDCGIDEECKIDDISNWNAEQLIMELDVLQTYALAIFLVEIEDYNYNKNEAFEYINSLNLGVDEKIILLLLYGGHTPSDLHDKDANRCVEYINDLNLSIEDKKIIFSYLGYEIRGNRVYW